MSALFFLLFFPLICSVLPDPDFLLDLPSSAGGTAEIPVWDVFSLSGVKQTHRVMPTEMTI